MKWGYVWVQKTDNGAVCTLWRAISLQRGGLEKNPLGFSHISMGATNPANLSQIGDIACAAVCRFLQTGAILKQITNHHAAINPTSNLFNGVRTYKSWFPMPWSPPSRQGWTCSRYTEIGANYSTIPHKILVLCAAGTSVRFVQTKDVVLDGNDDFQFTGNLADCLRACTDNRVRHCQLTTLSFCYDSAANQALSIVVSICINKAVLTGVQVENWEKLIQDVCNLSHF